jgi:hypothetical protein
MEGFSKLELQSRMQRETREGLEVVEEGVGLLVLKSMDFWWSWRMTGLELREGIDCCLEM